MRDLVRAAGIARENDRKALVTRGGGREPMPRANQVHRGIDPLAIGLVRQMCELQINIAFARRLEADDTGEQAPVHFRQHHMHGQVGRRQAAQRRCPILTARGRQHDLEYGTCRRVERRRAVVAGRREGGCVDDRRRRSPGKVRFQPFRHAGRLQRGRKSAVGIEPLLSQRRYQRINRPGVGRCQIGAIISHQRMRPSIRRRQRRQRALRRVVKTHVGDFGLAEHGPGIKTGSQRQLRNRDLRRHRAAGVAKRAQPPQGRDRYGRERIEPRVAAAIGRQYGKRDAAPLRELMQRVDTVGPIGFAADQANENAADLRQRALDISIDRERMAQRDQVGEPQRRQAFPPAPPAACECREVAVGKREHHEIGRILTEIDGCRGLLQAMALAEDDVHQTPNPTLIACSSISPCSPITTSLDCRGAAPHGLSN